MLKKSAFIGGCLLVLSGSVCFAESQEAQNVTSAALSSNQTIKSKNTQTVELSGKLVHTSKVYQHSHAKDIGWTQGYHLSYKNKNNSTHNYWQISYDNYNGDTKGDWTYSYKPDEKFTNIEAIYGVAITKQGDQSVYIGYGQNKYERNTTGSSTTYRADYMPIGYRYEFNINSKWDAAIDASWQIMFHSKANSGNSSYEATMGNRSGFKLEVPVNYKMDKNWNLVLTPWYQYHSMGDSNTYYGYRLHQYGMNVGVAYNF